MRKILFVLFMTQLACADDDAKEGEKGNNSNNLPTNNPVNNPGNNSEGATQFALVNDSEEPIIVAGDSSWVTVKNSGFMAFLWRATCAQCICGETCMPCDSPPVADPVELAPGESRTISWDGNRFAFTTELSCYAPQPAEDSSFHVTICYQRASEDMCETKEFAVGERVEIVVE